MLFSIVPPAITSTPSDAVVYNGDPYTVQCDVTGVPAPVIHYFFNATNVNTGVPGVTVNNGALTLASVTHANSGPYQCFTNDVHPISSDFWVVTVRDPGECYVRNILHLVLCFVVLKMHCDEQVTKDTL